MWSICKKELRQFFSSLTGYIAIIVFLLVNGLVLFVLRNNILEYGYATLEPFFSFAPWVLIFLVSAITMRSFSDEFKTGTFEILQTKPISSWQIVGGKFAGTFIVALIAILPTLVYYFSINSLAAREGIDAGAAAGAYLGLALLTGVFTAIGICVSSFTTNSVVAFIITLIACVLFYYGFTAISQLPAFANGLDYYIEMAGIDFHYQSISRGVIDTRDLIYFISVIVFFLWVTRRNMGERKAGHAAVGWIVLLVALFGVNAIATLAHQRFDLTQEKRYSLTPATHQLLRTLNEPVQIDVFLKGDLPSEFRKLANSTTEFVALLKDVNPSKVRYRLIDPQDQVTEGRSWGDSLTAMGATSINLNAQRKAGEESKIIFPYAIVHYGDRFETVNLFASSKKNITVGELNNAESMLEYGFAQGIDKLTHPQKPTVIYSSGNGEPAGAEAIDLVQTLRANYNFYTFNLNTQPYIPGPDTIGVLMIVKPALGFTDSEKLKIDQYLMRGGKVLWLIDDLFAEPDSLRFKSQLIAYERPLNLQELLFHYGVRINPDLLMDLQCDFLPFAVGGSNDNPQYDFLHWNYYPLFESRNNHPINKNLGLVAGRFVNSIDTVEADGVKKTFLLQSSANSRVISTPALISPNENRNAPQDALFNKKDIPVAVLLEGDFTSFFKGRISTAQRDTLKSSGGFRDAGNTQMIVVADGDLVLNDVSSKGPIPMGLNIFTQGSQYEYQFANREFLLNCIEYLTSKSSIIATRNKEIVLRQLDPVKVEAERKTWQFVNIGLPILLVILFGWIYIAIRRHQFAR